MTRRVRLGVLQFSPRFGAPGANLDRIDAMITASPRADLWVLPELCTTGYQFRSRAEAKALAEPLDGPSVARLRALARRRRIHLVAGFAERRGERLYNSALVISPVGLLGVYRKTHLFWREKRWFAPGDALPLFRTPWGPMGVLICYDWRFPEAARSLALRGAWLIAHPSNLVYPHAPDAMVTRALENRVWIATADRVGAEGRIPGERLRFHGMSQVVDPFGHPLVRLGRRAAGTAVVVADLALSRLKRLNALNHLFRDRRTDLYPA